MERPERAVFCIYTHDISTTLELPYFEVQPITSKDAPPPVERFLDGRSKMFLVPEDVKGIEGFSLFALITNKDDGVMTYVGQEQNIYTATDNTEETLLHTIDFVNHVEEMGHGEVRLGKSDEMFLKTSLSWVLLARRESFVIKDTE